MQAKVTIIVNRLQSTKSYETVLLCYSYHGDAIVLVRPCIFCFGFVSVLSFKVLHRLDLARFVVSALIPATELNKHDRFLGFHGWTFSECWIGRSLTRTDDSIAKQVDRGDPGTPGRGIWSKRCGRQTAGTAGGERRRLQHKYRAGWSRLFWSDKTQVSKSGISRGV